MNLVVSEQMARKLEVASDDYGRVEIARVTPTIVEGQEGTTEMAAIGSFIHFG
jgi:hypothetical protein